MSKKGINFDLSDEILAIIPTDPYDQLDLARKITSMAIASRVSTLESEIMKLKQNVAEKDKKIVDLQEQVKDLDRMFEDSEGRFRAAIEENGKLKKERDMLALTTKKLGKDLSKLEAFKRQLMLSLSDDKSSLADSVNIPSGYRPIARTSSWGEETPVTNRGSDSMDIENQNLDVHAASGSQGSNKLSLTPYLTPRHTPSATPTAVSTVASPRGFSTAGSSPRLWSGSASPTKSRFDGLSSGFTTSNTPTQQSSASSSPPSGRVPRIDGKEFFRQARSRLTLEQFGAFLANIKELNAHKQSREETLKKAEEIFGTDNKDLYISFQRMLIRNLP